MTFSVTTIKQSPSPTREGDPSVILTVLIRHPFSARTHKVQWPVGKEDNLDEEIKMLSAFCRFLIDKDALEWAEGRFECPASLCDYGVIFPSPDLSKCSFCQEPECLDVRRRMQALRGVEAAVTGPLALKPLVEAFDR